MKTREAAATVIQKVLQGAFLSDALPPVLAKIPAPRDRAFIQSLCYGTCRWYFELEAILSRLLDSPLKSKDLDIHILLLLGLYQLLHANVPPHAAVAETVAAVPARKAWARRMVNAILRRCQREKPVIDFHTHPDWWLKRLQADWPHEASAIVLANHQHPPLTLRVNRLKISREDYLGHLSAKDMAAHAVADTEAAIQLEKPVPVTELPGFDAGWVSVQDAAAQLAGRLLTPKAGDRVLDACAAPGGKTTHLLEMEPALKELIAIDKRDERLSQVRENLQRLKLSCKVIAADVADTAVWWDNQPFDRILLDAPCSASGVVRRHPDIPLLRKAEDIPALAREQHRLLNALWPLLAPGGTLLYATCSVFQEENTDVLTRFLAGHPDAHENPIAANWGRPCLIGRQILPGEGGMDGFYYAVLQKREHKPA